MVELLFTTLKALYLIPGIEKRKQTNKTQNWTSVTILGRKEKSTLSQKAILDRCLAVHTFKDETKQQKKKLFTTEWHWVYQPHSSVGPKLKSSLPTQIKTPRFPFLSSFFFPFFLLYLLLFVLTERKNNEVRVDMKEHLGGVGEGKEHDQKILQKIPKY